MSHPLSYYRDLRSQGLLYETADHSRVIKVTTEDGEKIRLIHISQLALVSVPGFSVFNQFGLPIRVPANNHFVYWEAGAFMAAKHFNDRDSSLIPGLAERLKGCNLHLTLDLLDSQLSASVASRQLYNQLIRNNSLNTPIPSGVVGSFSSTTTQPLAILSGAFETPHVGASSSASLFDVKGVYPFFTRTIPSNRGYARAAVELLQHWGVKYVACIYTQSEYGLSFFRYFQQAANSAGLQIVSAGYDSSDKESVIRALTSIKASGFRYVMGIISPSEADLVLEPAVDLGLVGNDFQWVAAQFGSTASPRYKLPLDRLKFATALHGIASVELETPSSFAFFNQMQDLSFNPELQNFFIDSHIEPFLYDGYKWNESLPILTTFAYTGFDALMALGISACEAEQDYFTGLNHLEQLKKTTFEGVSGSVAFDAKTGSRTIDGFKYVFTNILVDFTSTQDGTGLVSFVSRPSIEVNFSRPVPLKETTPFLFYSGNNTMPAQLPPTGEVDLHLIPLGIQIFGWVLCGVVMLLSIALGLYTLKYRREKLIRASQPIFLGMLCTGTFIMGTAIIPLGLQEPTEGLDAACVSAPWLITIGFSTAFSALFTKTWRINSLFKSAAAMQMLEIKATDVIWPFTVLTIANIIVLMTWTIMSPLEYQRTELDSSDQYGRPIESYGACQGSDDNSPIFLVVLFAFNFLAVALANYQSVVGRNVPSEFNESAHIALSMASILECFLIGAPILVFVRESPSSDFLVKSLLLFFTSLAILLPLFVPKITARGSREDVNINSIHDAMLRHSRGNRSGIHSTRESRSRESFQSRNSSTSESALLPSSVAQLRASIAAKRRRSPISSGDE